MPDAPSGYAGFPPRSRRLSERAAGAGFDLSAAECFPAFGRWKMARIIEGAHARVRKGAGGGMKTGAWADLEAAAEVQPRRAQKRLERLRIRGAPPAGRPV